jgi:hypothetical protein
MAVSIFSKNLQKANCKLLLIFCKISILIFCKFYTFEIRPYDHFRKNTIIVGQKWEINFPSANVFSHDSAGKGNLGPLDFFQDNPIPINCFREIGQLCIKLGCNRS